MSQLLRFTHRSLLLAWVQGWHKVMGVCTLMGDLEEVAGSVLHRGAAPAIAAHWGVNQMTEDLFVYPFLLKAVKISKS